MNKVSAGEYDKHQPVMLAAVLEGLAIKPTGRYLDATFGRGGHSAAMLEQLSPAGRLLALDRDPTAEQYAEHRFGDDSRFSFTRADFAAMRHAVMQQGWDHNGHGLLDGILMDVGVSSPQLDDPQRGFSFMRDGPLDMRMDPDSGESAAAWLARATESEIANVLWRYGEERRSRAIARAIVAARAEAPLTRTSQLAELIAGCVRRREPGQHPATRSFQAIRIHINGELEQLQQALHAAVDLLRPGGRLAVISFHSLEDRIVKRTLREYSQPPAGDRRLPPTVVAPRKMRLLGRAQKADDAEVRRNPRSRSAVLRVGERR